MATGSNQSDCEISTQLDAMKLSEDHPDVDISGEEPNDTSVVSLVQPSPSISISTFEGDPPDIEEAMDDIEGEDMEGVMSSNKSLVLSILSQIKIGMDLTKFVLPVFILEGRSLLEMYAEFFAHPVIIAGVNDIAHPKDRMIALVRWYLSSISASRKGVAPKKPYNPVLGETFQCYWDLPGSRVPPDQQAKTLLESGPVPYAGYNSVALVAEQVSHHPPISAFYCECPSKNMCVSGTISTKTKFLGLSVKAQNTGSVSIKFMNHGEEYIGNLPNGYARSVLTVPWFEFGGDCTLECAKTGYKSKIEFHTKPLRGGKRHKVTAEVFHKSEKAPCYKIEGEWNTVMYGKIPGGRQEVFFDCANTSTVRKKWRKLSALEPHDSRIVWQHVTEAIKNHDAEAAAKAKHQVEEKQRAEAKERAKTGEGFKHRHFHKNEAEMTWSYVRPLNKRSFHI